MADVIAGIPHPELVVGIAGPIGIDIEAITEAVSESFESVGYRSVEIRITDEISELPSNARITKRTDYNSVIRYKMKHATAICRKNNDQAYLMRIAIDAIQRERGKIAAGPSKDSSRQRKSRVTVAAIPQRIVYVIRQLKRPQEVLLFREVYGRQFILVSAYGSQDARKAVLKDKLRRSMSLGTKPARISALAGELIQIDADEGDDQFGQHMRDAFHLADVFVDGIEKGR